MCHWSWRAERASVQQVQYPFLARTRAGGGRAQGPWLQPWSGHSTDPEFSPIGLPFPFPLSLTGWREHWVRVLHLDSSSTLPVISCVDLPGPGVMQALDSPQSWVLSDVNLFGFHPVVTCSGAFRMAPAACLSVAAGAAS